MLPSIAGFDPNREMDGYEYDEEKAHRASSFFPECLKHVKNSRFTRAADPFVLNAWQKTFIELLFGIVDTKTGLRRFKTAYCEVPRKNGKTTMAAGIALYGLFADNEDGAECYCAAGSRDQSSLLFDIAAGMVRKNQAFSVASTIKESIKRIVYKASYIRAVASDAHTLHGQNAHICVADEVHAWAKGGYDLWEVLETGAASRAQPIMAGITTAGFDKQTKCWDLHEYAASVRDGTINDPSFLPVIYGAEHDEDWRSPEVWAKANPNLGVSIPVEYLQQKSKQAEANPNFQNAFRRLHLNQWTSQRNRWFDMSAWDACES